MALIPAQAPYDDKIRGANIFLSVRVHLGRAHQDIGVLLKVADAETSDRLVIAQSYINQALKELKKIDDEQVEEA